MPNTSTVLKHKYVEFDMNDNNRYSELNGVLVRLFNEIMDIEGRAIITSEYRDITNNDMHVIDIIGIEDSKNMSTIAKELSVTVGSLTTAINGLVRKGYVIRQRSEEDRRVVNISLSDRGREAYYHHEKFHREMVESLLSQITAEEARIVMKALQKLEAWLLIRRNEDKENKQL